MILAQNKNDFIKMVKCYYIYKVYNCIVSLSPKMHQNTQNPIGSYKNDYQEYINNSPQSISWTPSPKPSHNFLQFTLNSIPSTQNEIAIIASPPAKESRRGRKLSQQSKNMNRGHWSYQQNKKYHWFLEIHYAHFVNRHMRRMDKIFKTMELFVGTRQAEQCRSHHQKMEKKYLNFATIIVNLRKLHYDSLDIEPIVQELTTGGVSLIDGLATIQYLKQQQDVDPTVWQLKQRKKSSSSKKSNAQRQQQKKVQDNQNIQLCRIQQEKYEQLQQNRVNMLEESIMNIGELNLYHQKEENSSIFNSLLL